MSGGWGSFVAAVKALPEPKQRAVSAVVGAVVGDAAAYPLHWVYDQDKIARLLEGGKNPEFFQPTQNPFFILPLGSQTSYGDSALAGLRALVQGKGLNVAILKEELYKTFGPDSPYGVVELTGQYPLEGPYPTHVIKSFVKNYEAGTRTGVGGNMDGEGLCMAIPVLALSYDTADVNQLCTEAVTVFQDNAAAINSTQAACTILQAAILNGPNPADTTEVIASTAAKYAGGVAAALRAVVDMTGPVPEATKKFGLACSLPQTLQAALYATKGPDMSYVKAVRSTIAAGGNSAFRAAAIGAIMAAKYGIDGIPADWIEKVTRKDELMELSLKFAELMK